MKPGPSGPRRVLLRPSRPRRASQPSTQFPKAAQRHDAPRFTAGDVFVFGSETSGLPDDVLARFAPPHRLRLPMRAHSRSLNLSNAVAVMVYEAWRQLGYPGAA